jgi:hypothetical protein
VMKHGPLHRHAAFVCKERIGGCGGIQARALTQTRLQGFSLGSNAVAGTQRTGARRR